MKTKFKSSFYLLVALAAAGFGSTALAQADSTSHRGVYFSNAVRVDLPAVAGTQCGWVGTYNGYLGSRIPCAGNTLGLGNAPICPPGAAPARNGLNQCEVLVPAEPIPGCIPNNRDNPCGVDSFYTVASVGSVIVLATHEYLVSNWNCPSGYTFTSVITGGGSNGEDRFYTCVKN